MTGEQAGAAHGAERVNPLGVFHSRGGSVERLAKAMVSGAEGHARGSGCDGSASWRPPRSWTSPPDGAKVPPG